MNVDIEESIRRLESHVGHESQMYPSNWYVMVGEKLRAAEELARSCERRLDLSAWQLKALAEYETVGTGKSAIRGKKIEFIVIDEMPEGVAIFGQSVIHNISLKPEQSPDHNTLKPNQDKDSNE